MQELINSILVLGTIIIGIPGLVFGAFRFWEVFIKEGK